jgi:hypothetical protein
MEGLGLYRFSDGRVYYGSFRNGIRHGRGRLTQKNGDYYEGCFEAGKMTGAGRAAYPSQGREFVGHFIDGKKTFGRIIFQDGKSYVGEWLNDRPHGKGTMRLTSGDVYVGELKEGRMHGRGTCTYHSQGGKRYEGEFEYDKPHGAGVMYYLDGAVVEAQWENGRQVGRNRSQTMR